MPHIDSIHSMNYDLQMEILSHQIRSIPEDSTQEEAYLNEGEEGKDGDEGKEAEERRSHHRVIDKERIKHWLETQNSSVPPDSN